MKFLYSLTAIVVGLLVSCLSSGCSSSIEKHECWTDEDCASGAECRDRQCETDPLADESRPAADLGTDSAVDAGRDVAIDMAMNDSPDARTGCLDAGPQVVDFGTVAAGDEKAASVELTNCGESDVTIGRLDTCETASDGECSASTAYQVKDPDTLSERTLSPDESVSVTISFTGQVTPSGAQPDGELRIWSPDLPEFPTVIPLQAAGVLEGCPTAEAEAKLSDSARWQSDLDTIPLKTVQFRGTNSIDPDGSIAEYEWILVQTPENSTARFTPAGDVAETEMFLDLSGEYTVELKVYDDDGLESCGEPALIHIHATPDEDISIELTWDTPSDIDQTDANGTDLDLHFLHPNGQWNTPPYDVYWNNPNPTAGWGGPDPSDDPSLHIDDTDGAGPEMITLTDPESGLTYAVGVYYYASEGLGPSYATIRIFIRGTQEFEWEEMYLPSDQSFWYAATIEWPSTEILPVNQVQQGFPSDP